MTHEVKWGKDSDRDHKELWGAQARRLGGLESHELANLQVSNSHLEDINSVAVLWHFGPWREKETMIKWRLIMHGRPKSCHDIEFFVAFWRGTRRTDIDKTYIALLSSSSEDEKEKETPFRIEKVHGKLCL